MRRAVIIVFVLYFNCLSFSLLAGKHLFNDTRAQQLLQWFERSDENDRLAQFQKQHLPAGEEPEEPNKNTAPEQSWCGRCKFRFQICKDVLSDCLAGPVSQLDSNMNTAPEQEQSCFGRFKNRLLLCRMALNVCLAGPVSRLDALHLPYTAATLLSLFRDLCRDVLVRYVGDIMI
mgnify:CR=1 FL=1